MDDPTPAQNDYFEEWLDSPTPAGPVEEMSPAEEAADRLFWGKVLQLPGSSEDPAAGRIATLDEAPEEPRSLSILPFVRDGDCVFLVGEKGQGKSTFTADLIFAAASACFLPDPSQADLEVGAGALKIVPEMFFGGAVGILDAENEARDWNEFLTATAAARGFRPDDERIQRVRERVYHLPAFRWPLCPQAHPHEASRTHDELFQTIRDRDIRMLIVDPLAAVWGRQDQNRPEWVRKGLEPFAKRLKSINCILWLLAHPSRFYPDKPAQNLYNPIGASAQEGLADCIIGMYQPPQEREKRVIRMTVAKRRGGKWVAVGAQSTLRGTPLDGGYASCARGWSLEDDRDKNVAVMLSEAERRLLLACPREGVWQQKALVDAVGLDQSNVSRGMKESLLAYGLVEHVGGTGKRNDPKTYRLTDDGHSAFEFYAQMQAEAEEDVPDLGA